MNKKFIDNIKNDNKANEALISFDGKNSFSLYPDYLTISPDSKDLIKRKKDLRKIFYSSLFASKSVLDASNTNGFFAFWSLFKGAGKVHLKEENEKNIQKIDKIIQNLKIDDFTISKLDPDSKYDIVILEDEVIFNSDEFSELHDKDQLDIPLEDIFLELNERNCDYTILKNHEIISKQEDVFSDMTIDVFMDSKSIEVFESNINDVIKASVNGKVMYQFPIGEINGTEVFLNVNVIEEFNKEIISGRTQDRSIIHLNTQSYLKYLTWKSIFFEAAANPYYTDKINEILNANGYSANITTFRDLLFLAELLEIKIENYNDHISNNSLKFIEDPNTILFSNVFVIEDIKFVKRVHRIEDYLVINLPKPIADREFKLFSKLLGENVWDYEENGFEASYKMRSKIIIVDEYQFYLELMNDRNLDPDTSNFEKFITMDESYSGCLLLIADQETSSIIEPILRNYYYDFGSIYKDGIDLQLNDLSKNFIKEKWGVILNEKDNNVIKQLDNYLTIDLSGEKKENLFKNTEESLKYIFNLLNIELPKDTLLNYSRLVKSAHIGKDDTVEIYAQEANELIKEEKFEEAIEKLDDIIENSGRLSSGNNILFTKAVCLANIGRIEEAIKTLQEEIMLNPDNEKAYELQDQLEKNRNEISYDSLKYTLSIISINSDIKIDDENIEIIENPKDLNKAIKNTKSEKVIIAEDILFEIQDLNNLLELISENSVVGAKVTFEHPIVYHGGVVWGKVSQEMEMPYFLYPASNPSGPQVNKRRNMQMLGGGFLAFTKNTYNESTGFDAFFNSDFKYYDFCLGSSSKGIEIIYEPKIEVITKRPFSAIQELTNRVVLNENSTESKELEKLNDKWNHLIEMDDWKYYDEDQMWGFSTEKDKFEKFQEAVKSLFDELKSLPESDFQEKAQSISKLLFGRTGVDFTRKPELLINVGFDQLVKAKNQIQKPKSESFGFSNNEASGSLPEILPSPLKLNLGCGKDVRESYLNLDLFSDDPRVIKMDIRKLEFEDNSVDGILASDVLEHFSHRETYDLLKEWNRVLKPGGQIIIRCPNLKLQMQAYMRGDWDADIASFMIFGGQTNPGDYHCIGFDKESIEKHLNETGFKISDYKEEDFPQNEMKINLNMIVTAHKEDPNAKQEFDISEKVVETPNEKPRKPRIPNKNDSTKQLNIVWEGSQMIYHSLALVNRELCSSIIDSNAAELTIIPFEKDAFTAEGNDKFEKLQEYDVRYKEAVSSNLSELPYVWIRHQWPPKKEAPEGAEWIMMQPWEYSSLTKEMFDTLSKADEIWTPSNFSRKSMIFIWT